MFDEFERVSLSRLLCLTLLTSVKPLFFIIKQLLNIFISETATCIIVVYGKYWIFLMSYFVDTDMNCKWGFFSILWPCNAFRI